MKKALVQIVIFVLITSLGACNLSPQSGSPGTTSAPEIKPPEKPFSFEQPTPTVETGIARYTENDTFDTLAAASPYYLGNQPSELPGLIQYETLKQKKIDEAVKLTDDLVQAAKELKSKLEPYKSAYIDFVAITQEKEKRVQKYAAESSGQILEYLITEEALIANYESIHPEQVNHLLTRTMLQYQRSQLAMQLGETVIRDVTYVVSGSSALYNVFTNTTDPDIKDQLPQFQAQLEKIDQMNVLIDQVVGNQLYLAIALKQLETADYYMTQASLEFINQGMPEIKAEMAKITANDILNTENVEAINEYGSVIETFMDDLQKNMDSVDTSTFFPADQTSKTALWGIDQTMAGYAPAESQKLLGAYSVLTKPAQDQQLPSTWSKIGGALKAGASFTWSGIKSGFSKAQTGVGVTLDTLSAGTKSIFDAGFGLANGNSVTEVTTEIAGNFKKVGDNYGKGTSGSQVLKDAGKMLKGAEEAAGGAAEAGVEYVAGKGWTSWAVGGITKTTVGMFTGFGKGIYKLADKQATTGEFVEGMLDVGLSLIGGSKVIVKGSQALSGGKELAKWSAEKAFNFLKVMGNKLEQGQLKAMTAEILKNAKLTPNQVLSLISNSLEMEGKAAIAAELKAISAEMNERFGALVKDGLKTILANLKTVPGKSYSKWVSTAFEDSLKGFKDAMIARLGEGYKEYIDNLVAAQMNRLIKTAIKEYVDALTAPTLQEIAGTWDKGTMVITDVIVSEEFRAQAEKEGCNIADIEAQKGKSQPMSMTLSPSGEAGGSMTLKIGSEGGQSVPFTYSDGLIKASPAADKGASGSITMNVTRTDLVFNAAGTLVIDYKGQLKIIASVTASKAAPPPPPAPETEQH